MNYPIILQILGKVLRITGLLMLIPAGLSVCYQDGCAAALGGVALGMVLLGSLLVFSFRKASKTLYAREGFLIVALAWFGISVCGALPFVITGEIPNFIDAFFETVSGFTTTGSTLLTDIESMSKSLLFWRSFTHWIGGMGVLVFVMAVVPLAGNRAMHLLRAEAPGPVVEKMVPKARTNALLLYAIYIGITLLEILFLLPSGMPLYDCFITTFGTVGTGGYSNLSASIAGYNSPYVEGVVTAFMFLCGINFSVLYAAVLRRNFKAWKSEELRWYILILAVSVLIITVNILPIYPKVTTAFRYAVFQAVSVNTTTGYATADFNRWPELSKMVLLGLMLFGCCAGSTGGGLKTVRVVIAVKGLGREVRRMLHTRSVSILQFEGKPVREETANAIFLYIVFYVAILAVSTFLIAVDGFDFTSNFTAVLATLSNIGPGLNMVGPAGSFADYSGFSKLVLCLDMLLGRLEIYPLILACMPSTWKR